jgi:hypothetical protein
MDLELFPGNLERKPMNVKIHIDRAAAIRAGHDVFGDTVVSIHPGELTPEEREILLAAPVTAFPDNFPDLTNAGGNLYPGKYPPPPALADAADALAAVRAWLAWRGACQAEQKRVATEEAAKVALAAKEAMDHARTYVAYWREQPPERFFRLPCPPDRGPVWPYVELPAGREGEPGRDPMERDRAAMAFAKAELADRISEAVAILEERRRLRVEEAKEAEIAAKEAEARRLAQISDWVRDHGTPNQQGRHSLGLLPESEVIDAIRGAAYAALDGFPRYVKIRMADIDHEDDCGGFGELSCATSPAGALTASEYDDFTAIQRAAPADAELEALAHACSCSECHATTVRRSVRVAIKVGELSFSREYALNTCYRRDQHQGGFDLAINNIHPADHMSPDD